MELQARVWYTQHRLKEAWYEASRAADVFEKLGAAPYLEKCRGFPQRIRGEMGSPVTHGQSGFNRESLQMMILSACTDSKCDSA